MSRTSRRSYHTRTCRPVDRHGAPGKQKRHRTLEWLASSFLTGVAVTYVLTTVGGPIDNNSAAPKPIEIADHPPDSPIVSSIGIQSESGSAEALLALSDEELEALDPALVNLIVARGIPDLEEIDPDTYLRKIDDWAKLIENVNAAAVTHDAMSDPAFQHDPDLWACGNMAIILAGSAVGIAYTADKLDPGDPSQTFLPGLIDHKRGTCASMPILYLAIGHRLGWPLKGVVSKDHFWVRWDDGQKQFNLEATNASVKDGNGGFSSTSDEEYEQALGTPRIAIESGSDFNSLTARQSLGVYLQMRAAFFKERGDWDRAEHDLLLARTCFPENRDIYHFLIDAMARRADSIFEPKERFGIANLYLAGEKGLAAARQDWPTPKRSLPSEALDRYRLMRLRQAEIDRINRENEERIERQIEQLELPQTGNNQ